MDTYFDLGEYRRSITSDHDAAQTWFNRGLVWCYAFNQEEALRCFEKVVEIDPNCAMGYWGLAYAAGPFYNKPWEWYGEEERLEAMIYCYAQAQAAKDHMQLASPLEQKLIQARCAKHPAPAVESSDEWRGWNLDYANQMRALYQSFPDDQDVVCLAAEAVMNLTPWKLWDLQRGVPATNAATEEAIEILEHGISLFESGNLPAHPGIVHFYIHVYEMSPTPEKALPLADRLRDLCPEAGHLLHMASHIDSLCGHWENAAEANRRAIEADRRYIEQRGSDEFYMISVVHNFDFKIWASMFLGQFEKAMAAADGICQLVRDKRSIGDQWYLASTLEAYYGGRAHVFVRFGKWQEICDEEMPDDPDSVPVTSILLVYAKAIAHAALGDLESARNWQADFRRRLAEIPDWHIVANNPTRDVLAVGEAMMDGEVEYHAGNHELGFEHLRRASALFDDLEYSEPWPWMHPPRHALGALLLEQGQVDEAITHYEDDLGVGNRLPRCVQHPDNIWALHGYHECLNRLGRVDEAAAIKPRLDELVQNADIEIKSSCCCRGMH